MKSVPMELLELIRKATPPEAGILSLPWAYEHEDYNIAVVVPDTTSYEEARQIEDRCIDAVMDYDAGHGTFTLCIVWRELEMAQADVR